MADWCKYYFIIHSQAEGRFVDFDKVTWPPSIDTWKACLLEARQHVSSYERFRAAAANVCYLATRHPGARTGVLDIQLDPRMLYASEHRRILSFINSYWY